VSWLEVRMGGAGLGGIVSRVQVVHHKAATGRGAGIPACIPCLHPCLHTTVIASSSPPAPCLHCGIVPEE